MSSPSFRDAHFRGDAGASALLPRQYASLEGRVASVHAAAMQGLSDIVRAELVRQNSAFARDTTRLQFERLHHPQVTFVVTGQQTGLFGGPLYAMHKAASAVHLARQLEEESGTPVIPVFWLQTEDHDAAEISSATLIDARGRVHQHSVALEGAGRTSVAHLTLQQDVASILDELTHLRGQSPEQEQATALLQRCWYAGRLVHEAFAEYVMAMLGPAGLLVFHPRTETIAPLAAPLHAWAIEKQADIAATLQHRSRELHAAGFGDQIPLRSNCCLNFVHPDAPEGARFRLQRHGDGWQIPSEGGVPRTVSDAQLREWLSDEPLRFSTSALLRPLLQDALLPTAAWLGGPAEVHYMAQVLPLYQLRGQRYPLFVPRASLQWVPRESADVLDSLGLSPRELAKGPLEAARLSESRTKTAADDALPTRLTAALLAAFDETTARFASELHPLGDTAAKATEKTRQHLASGLEKYAQKIERSLLMQQHDRLHALEQLCDWFWPAGQAQERSAAWWSVASRFGSERAVEQLLADASPLLPSPREVRL